MDATLHFCRMGPRLYSLIPLGKKQCAGNAEAHAASVGEKSVSGRGKAIERNNENGGGNYNADDCVERCGMMVFKQEAYGFGEKENREQGAKTCGQQHTQVKSSDAVHKGRVQTKGHKQCGKAHARRNYTERKAKAAEKVPEEAGRNFDSQGV